jgi:hypothetical protein
MRSLVLAAIIAIGAVAAGPWAATSQAKVRHVCPITRTCKHCPTGEWDCNGKCIPKKDACRIT